MSYNLRHILTFLWNFVMGEPVKTKTSGNYLLCVCVCVHNKEIERIIQRAVFNGLQ